MRLRIRSHKGLTGPIAILGHDLKLGKGGIREIEFFTQTRQLITGGRDPDLRAGQTLAALAALAGKGWVDSGAAEELAEAYVAHRTLEHRLQMLDDAQTHRLPASDADMARLADFCDAGPETLSADLRDRLERVHSLTEPFFAQEPGAAAPAPEVGEVFADPERGRSDHPRLAAAARLSQRARARDLPPSRARTAAADGAARSTPTARCNRSTPSSPACPPACRSSRCSTPIRSFSTCSWTSARRRRNSRVISAATPASSTRSSAPDFFGPLRGAEVLRAELAGLLDGTPDYQAALDLARVWTKERHFRIGVHLLRGIAEADEAAAAYSAVAEAVLQAILPRVTADFATRHGPPPGAGAAVMALGKLGSREMTASSDLDLIVIYDAMGAEASEGKRPLAVAVYYARLTQALIAALSAPMPEGILFKVDMRLRPSGRQGPVATSLAGFRRYQSEEAWTWEHLALTRARVVAGPEPLFGQVSAAIAEVLATPHDATKVLADARDMRRRLAEAHGATAGGPWEVKLGPGRMMDIELLAQSGALIHTLSGLRRPRRMLERLTRLGWLAADDGARLVASLARLSALQQVGRLASDHTIDPAEGGEGLVRLVLATAGATDLAGLRDDLAEEAAVAAAIIDARLAAP